MARKFDPFNKRKIQSLETDVRETRKSMKTQMLLIDDLLTARAREDGRYRGNEYNSYESAIPEIVEKYNAVADWGVIQTGNIIDLRAAFIIGQGINIIDKTTGETSAEREIKWAEQFLEYNGLDEVTAIQFATEAEIEGKFLGRMMLDKVEKTIDENEKMASVRFISWAKRKYKVKTDQDDYTKYESVSYRGRLSGPYKWKAEILKPPDFVYIKFGGRIDEPNQTQPKIMKCLTQIEYLDKALRDLREINRLFSAPTPYFKCKTKEEADSVMAEIAKNPNFRIKKMLASTAEFMFVSPDVSGVDNLINEIVTLIKVISGTTGVPIHFLGLLDLLKNRATGENTRELMIAGTTKERSAWQGGFYEMIKKGMYKYNATVYDQKGESNKLDPRKIGVELPVYTQEQWDHLEKVLIPASQFGIISKEFVRDKIPGIDSKLEERRKAEADNTALDAAKKENEDLKIEIDQIGKSGGVQDAIS